MKSGIGSRCEINAQIEHQNAGKHTNVPAGKIQEKRLKPAWLSRFSLAGAEGLEPSARGFGVDVGKTLEGMQQQGIHTVERFWSLRNKLQRHLMLY